MSIGSSVPTEQYVPSRAYTLALTLLLVAGVAGADYFELTRWLNVIPYDAFCRLSARNPTDESQILLVEADPQRLHDHSSVRELIRKLHALKAQAIATTFDGVQAKDLLDQCTGVPNLVIGVRGDAHGVPADRFGSIDLLPSENGMRRWHFTTRPGQSPSIQAQLLADPQRPPHPEKPAENYLVRFRGGPDSLFHVSAASVLANEVTDDLVGGKFVLIGQRHLPGQPGVCCPTAPEQPMSALEYHGHALDTLVHKRVVRQVPAAITVLIYLVMGLLMQPVSRRTGLRGAALFMAGVLFSLGLFSWLMFRYAQVWVPFLSVVLLQSICHFCVHSNRYRYLRAALALMSERQQLRNKRHRVSTDFLSSEDPWCDIANLLHQMFHFDRLVLLELPPGKVHLRVKRLVHCVEEDVIIELRRDIRRVPYADAIEAKKIQEIAQTRPFFNDNTAPESSLQYVCPLMVGGMVLGFLAIEVAESTIDLRHEFEEKMQRLCDEFAALLAHRRRLDRAVAIKQHWTRKCVEISEESVLDELGQNERLTALRETHYLSAFQASHSASAIADAVGQVVGTNSRMDQVLRDLGVSASDLSVVELLSHLGQLNHHDARRMLRDVVFDESKQTVLVNRDEEAACLLEVQAIRSRGSNQAIGDAHEPFAICGFRVELIFGEEFDEIHRTQDDLKSQAYSSVAQSLHRIQDRMRSLDEGETAAREMELDLRHALTTLREFDSYQTTGVTGRSEDTFPVNVGRLLEKALAAAEVEAESRGITIKHPVLPDDVTVVSHPQLVGQVFERCLGFALHGANDESALAVEFVDEGSMVSFAFRNAGFGISVQRLREVLADDAETNRDDFHQLRELQSWMKRWGGWLTVSSEVGEGTTLKIALRRHSWCLDHLSLEAERSHP